MRTLIAALTLLTSTALGSTAYAAPTQRAYDAPTVTPVARSYDAPASIQPAAAAIPTCALSTLPAQASDTLELIHSGGPFPYPQDGTVFQNREGILPAEPSGYYHETP